jgi:hypothetical protein
MNDLGLTTVAYLIFAVDTEDEIRLILIFRHRNLFHASYE